MRSSEATETCSGINRVSYLFQIHRQVSLFYFADKKFFRHLLFIIRLFCNHILQTQIIPPSGLSHWNIGFRARHYCNVLATGSYHSAILIRCAPTKRICLILIVVQMILSYPVWQNNIQILKSFFAPLVIYNLRVHRIL